MLFAAYEPGQAMAIANFSLAIFCAFTICLPFLLITRGDKTEANREFLVSTVNPWSQIDPNFDLTSTPDSGIIQANEIPPKLELLSDSNITAVAETDVELSTEPNGSEELVEAACIALPTTDEAIAA